MNWNAIAAAWIVVHAILAVVGWVITDASVNMNDGITIKNRIGLYIGVALAFLGPIAALPLGLYALIQLFREQRT